MSEAGQFDGDGNWYKANLHAHTTESDGITTPAEVARRYELQGYDVLAFTDHGTVTSVQGLSTDKFLCMQGVELACGRTATGSTYHIVGLDVPVSIVDVAADEPQQLLDAIAGTGAIGFVAHPYWSSMVAADFDGLQRCLGIEVINYGCEVEIGRGISSVHWDDLMVRRNKYLGIGVDDGHRCGWDFYGGFTMINAPELSRQAIKQALRAGNFYPSMGPIIKNVQVTADRITVASSPAQSIKFIADNQKGACVHHIQGPPLTEGSYAITGSEKYVRAEIIAPDGSRAWTQPIFFDA